MGVARFSFHDLCEEPHAAADYLKIAHEFHTVLLDGVPVMDYAHRNEAKRFIILIDTFYDNAVKLVASAAGRARRALYGRQRIRDIRIQAHRLAAHGDALALVLVLAAWARRCGTGALHGGPGGDLILPLAQWQICQPSLFLPPRQSWRMYVGSAKTRASVLTRVQNSATRNFNIG